MSYFLTFVTDGQTYEQTKTMMYQLYRKILGEIVDGVTGCLDSWL